MACAPKAGPFPGEVIFHLDKSFVLAKFVELFVDCSMKTYPAPPHRRIIRRIADFHERNQINRTVIEHQ